MNTEARATAVPDGRLSRLARLGSLATGGAGGMLAEGARQLAAGKRPTLSELVLTPANARRVADQRRQEQADVEKTVSEKELTVARLNLLNAQVEPHFLYNTLASAQVLTRTDPPRADVMLGHLIQYLRSSLPRTEDTLSTLGEELERTQAYLEILKIRMGNRLNVQVEVPDALKDPRFADNPLVTGEGGIQPAEFATLSALVRDIADGVAELDRRTEATEEELALLRRPGGHAATATPGSGRAPSGCGQ